MNFIGIDWGERKIGTAFGDDEMWMAFGGSLLENDTRIFEELKNLADEHDAQTFVVGNTSHADQNDNHEKIEKFSQQLEQTTSCEVVFVDEMFTTHEAQNNLKQAGKKNLAKYDDVEASRILLQGYLDNLAINK